MELEGGKLLCNFQYAARIVSYNFSGCLSRSKGDHGVCMEHTRYNRCRVSEARAPSRNSCWCGAGDETQDTLAFCQFSYKNEPKVKCFDLFVWFWPIVWAAGQSGSAFV